MDLKGKKLLVLGGIALSCEIVRTAKAMGIETLVTDYLPDSPAKRIADRAFMVSTLDIDALEQLCREQHVDGVVTGYVDLLLPCAEQLCSRLGLPFYATADQIATTIDKRKFKSLCRQHGVPVVEEYEFDPLKDEPVGMGYPVLVKPIDASGARGIRVCWNREQLETAYAFAATFSKQGKALVERFVQGYEATAFYAMKDGEVILTGMGDRHIRRFSDNTTIALPVGYTYPSKYIDAFIRNVHPHVQELFQALHLQNGMAFLQMMVEDDAVWIYEMGYRLTGTMEHYMQEDATGYNPIKAMICHALTGSMGSTPSLAYPKDGSMYGNNTFYCKPGTIGRIEGLHRISALIGVQAIVQSYWPGDTIPEKARGTLGQVVIRVLSKARSREELISLMDRIASLLHVYDTNGNKMLLPGFEAAKQASEGAF